MRTHAKIYVMRADDGTIKLGHSVNPLKRSKQLGRVVEIVHETDVMVQAERIERLAHRVLALHGRHIKGEWFEATLEQATQAIDIAVRQAEAQELELGGRLNRADSARGAGIEWNLIVVRFPAEMIDALDHISATRMARPDRSELVREAVAKLIEQEAV